MSSDLFVAPVRPRLFWSWAAYTRVVEISASRENACELCRLIENQVLLILICLTTSRGFARPYRRFLPDTSDYSQSMKITMLGLGQSEIKRYKEKHVESVFASLGVQRARMAPKGRLRCSEETF